jgi:hypothetical protein
MLNDAVVTGELERLERLLVLHGENLAARYIRLAADCCERAGTADSAEEQRSMQFEAVQWLARAAQAIRECQASRKAPRLH